MSVQVQVEKLEHNMAKLTVTVPAETFDKGITQAYLKMRSQISLPGFRKGKVPQSMVEKMYGPEMFYEEATNIILPSTYDEAVLEAKDVHITSQPKIEFVQIGKGKDFIYTAEVATMPEAQLGEYKDLTIEQEIAAVTEEEVSAEIAKVQDKNAREVTVDGPAENGDIVIIDYAGMMDGEPFEGGKANGHSLTLGSNSFIPGFEEKLIGISAGEERDLDLVFPEDYFQDEMAGKPVVFHVKAKEVKRKDLPILDDEFAQDVSECDTLEEYKEEVKNQLLKQKEEQAEQKTRELAVDKVLETTEIDVPDPMAELQAKDMADRYSQQLAMNGLSMDFYLSVTGMSMDDFVAQMKPQAVKNIKRRIALKAVAEAEGITATAEELDAEYGKLAQQYNVTLEQVKDLLPAEMKETVEDDVLANKALDFVVGSANIVKVEKAEEEKVEAVVEE